MAVDRAQEEEPQPGCNDNYKVKMSTKRKLEDRRGAAAESRSFWHETGIQVCSVRQGLKSAVSKLK